MGYIKNTRKSEEDKSAEKMKGNLFSNFDDYNLTRPQIIRQDINKPGFRKNNYLFDVIVCDPPYGLRAAVRKTGLSVNKKEKRRKRLEIKRNKNNNEEDQKDKNIHNNEICEENTEIKNEYNNNIEKEDMDYNYCYTNGKLRMLLPTRYCSV